ncbi:hypothetical protein HYH02_000448 [Chlamydomonas schloesseri]|uniref:Uncharacterized protein n=1 Tax=Chlamydomonas schloesseri TaxID=2026947 RepID=A0A835WWB6_9CHLO|nr:hypothetical protein HYH02_000448 [Chlamydomonas schloesseri]|eukprot:KAG2454607.1 hypothetical protein HYH02_000448 [Chlamydomonas schloesseri]
MPTGLTPELAYFDAASLGSYSVTPGAPLDGATWTNGASSGAGVDLLLNGTGCYYDSGSNPPSVRMPLYGTGCTGVSNLPISVPGGAATFVFVMALHSNNDTVSTNLVNFADNATGTYTFDIFLGQMSVVPVKIDVFTFWPANNTGVLFNEPVYRAWFMLAIPLDTLDGVASLSLTQLGATDTQAGNAWTPASSSFTGVMRLGNSEPGTNQVDCSMAVALLYNRKLNSTDLATLRNHYSSRFGNFGPIYPPPLPPSPPSPPPLPPYPAPPSPPPAAAAPSRDRATAAAKPNTDAAAPPPPSPPASPSWPADWPSPPSPPPPSPSPPSPTAASTDRIFQAAVKEELPVLLRGVAPSFPLPPTRSLVLTSPSAVPLISGRIGQALVTVVAFSRYVRGTLTAFGSEGLLTGCCRPPPKAKAAGAAGGRRRRELLAEAPAGAARAAAGKARRAPTDVEQLILNAANASSHYGTKTGRKAILRVSDPALVPLAKFVARQLPDTFATPKQFGAPSHYLSLRAWLRDGHAKCDVYVVLSGYLEYLDPDVQRKFRDFVALGKGLMVAGPPVDAAYAAAAAAAAAAAGRRRGLLAAEDLLTDSSPAVNNITSSMGGISYGSVLPGGGSATTSNATSAAALNALQAVNDLLRDLKGDKALPEATRLETQYAFLQARADIDRLALAIPPDLRAKIDEYVILAKIPSPPPRPVARPPSPPQPSPRAVAPPSPAPSPPAPLNGTTNGTALPPPAPGGTAGQSPPPRGGRQRPPLPGTAP